jgi:alginate O-acetyltransferase complex protein AlgI
VLLLVGTPFFTVRYLCKSFNVWRDVFDAVGLAVLSLVLFVNTSPTSFFLFLFELVFNYLMVAWMLRQEGKKARLIATALIVFDIFILAYFKYLTFLVEDVVGLAVGIAPDWKASFPLPVFQSIPPGVSFYTFQMVAFVVDSLNARRKKPIKFLDYINFISFFPQIVAGPIERRSAFLPQIEGFKFKFTAENFDLGLRWLSLGLFMKFVLADNISPFINLDNVTNAWAIWFNALLFTLRIYFDFGGYSFMAVGLGRMMGVRLSVNFLAPYTSQSINEFWRRWHVSLSTWFRDYVFLPLMGKRQQWAPFYLFLTFTLSGFWHGAAWNFIAWGAYHGALLLLLRYAGRPFHKWIGKYVQSPQLVSWALTFGSVVLGCLFFMETNTKQLVVKLATLVTPWAYSPANLLAALGDISVNEMLALGFVLLLAGILLLLEHIAVWKELPSEYDLLLHPWVSKAMLGLTILLAANIPSEFIYFDF